MKGHLLMSLKELRRKTMLEGVKDGRLTLAEAARGLELSYRQTLRSWRRFQEKGDAGLVHRRRGQPSNRAKPPEFRQAVLKRYQERYEGFGPTLAAEKLAAEGYRLFRQTNRAVTLDEVNEHLRGLGLREVSPRMLVHYERLYRHGYSSYVPINRLDIALAGEDAWSDELQARYPEIAQPTPAEIIWDGRVRDVQVLSLGISTATITGDEIPRAGLPVVLRLLSTGIVFKDAFYRINYCKMAWVRQAVARNGQL